MPASHNSAAPGDLPRELRERVLERLGLGRSPDPTPESLGAIYGAWCQRVPFDNVQKLIHVRAGKAGRLPGSTPEDFFEAWLRFGTGGTCWPGAGAFHALLTALGFDASRGVATMLAAPDLPPNHGTVLVTFDQARYLVDTSMLHTAPLPLVDLAETAVEHPAWGVRCGRHDGRWHISWRPLHKTDGFECRLERFGAARQQFESLYEQTRGWSPFNYQLAARLNRGNEVVGVGFGHAVSLRDDGSVSRAPLSDPERVRLLIEDLGLAEEIVSQLPADVPTPPPPWSKTAAL